MDLIPEFCTRQYGGISFLTDCQFDFKLLQLDNLPDFYATVLKHWQDFNEPTILNEHILTGAEIIWNKKNIKIDGKPFFYNSWFKKGIIHINDLLNENYNFLSLDDLNEKFNLTTPFTTYYGHSLKPRLDSGLWTLDSGLWTLDSGLWTLDSGLWTLDSGLYFIYVLYRKM